jgi:signal transduction histidine kinase
VLIIILLSNPELSSMLSHIDSTYLCQHTAAQIKEIVVLEGVLIQQYQPQQHRWLTIAQLPDLGELTLNLEPARAQEIDRRLQLQEIIEFTNMTTVMSVDICDRYVFIPLLAQPDLHGNQQSGLWGRICLWGNAKSVWTDRDLSWIQALGQQLIATIDLLAKFTADHEPTVVNSSSLAYLAESIERVGELEAICQQKDDFINNIAHDLRAPLMNIKMAMQMLKISLSTDPAMVMLLSGHAAEKYLAMLEQECNREVELINHILDLQQLETEICQSDDLDRLNAEPIEIKQWVSTTIEPFTHRAQVIQQNITIALAESMPTVITDRLYLTKILTELLNNACKYTCNGGNILVAIDRHPNLAALTIKVKNQATIATEHLPRIFDQFYRIPGTNRSQQGTGLGLFLVQKLVQKLNGQINVVSSGGWTEFTVELPFKL